MIGAVLRFVVERGSRALVGDEATFDEEADATGVFRALGTGLFEA